MSKVKKSTALVSDNLPPEFREITVKQRMFVMQYAVTRSGIESARQAGYRGNDQTLRQIAHENLRKPDILRAYEAYMRPQFEQHGITIQRLLDEFAAIGFSDIGDIIDFTSDTPRMRRVSEISPSARRSISSMKVKRYMEGHGDDAQEVEVIEFKFWNKNEAMKEMAKMLRLIGEKNEELSQHLDQSQHLHLHKCTSADEARAALLAMLRKR